MRDRSRLLALALAGAFALTGSQASAQYYSERRAEPQLEIDFFYDNLAPYGDWLEMPEYGWAWAPRVNHYWRPYTRGQWIWTDYGWFWDSQEPFGWATYHYGRWVNDRYYGWVWIPDTEWGPSWVSWRYGNGYTGWAPLPPRATWQSRVGLSIGGLDIDAFISARDYCFVRDRSFVDRSIYQRILPPAQNLTIINVTNNVTRYEVVDDRVIARGIAPENVERSVGRRLRRARAIDVDRFNAPRRARADEVAVFRPEIRPGRGHRPKRGHSLVQGEAPPPVLVERRRVRERERKREGQQAELTAKDVEQRRPHGRAEDRQQHQNDRQAQQAQQQQQREQARQQAAQQQAAAQEQQRLEREKRQANGRQQQAEQQARQQQREQARQQAAQQHAAAQEQQRLEREKRQANDRQQQAEQHSRQQQREQARQQQAAAQEQQRLEREKRQANAQHEQAQRQAAQQQQREQARQQAAQQQREQARQQQAAAQEQQRLEREKRQAERQQREQGRQDPNEKGKKKPKAPPTPPPSEDKQ